jgi:hypothetical protein
VTDKLYAVSEPGDGVSDKVVVGFDVTKAEELTAVVEVVRFRPELAAGTEDSWFPVRRQRWRECDCLEPRNFVLEDLDTQLGREAEEMCLIRAVVVVGSGSDSAL